MEDLHLLEYPTTSKVLVVLDDDPTGTQTVHDIEVLTEWYYPGFFVVILL